MAEVEEEAGEDAEVVREIARGACEEVGGWERAEAAADGEDLDGFRGLEDDLADGAVVEFDPVAFFGGEPAFAWGEGAGGDVFEFCEGKVEGTAGEARVDEFAVEVEPFDEPWETSEGDAFPFSDGAEVEHETGLGVEVGEGAAAEEDEACDHEHAEGEEEPVAGGPEDEEAGGESG